MRFIHTCLRVRDAEQSLRFYRTWVSSAAVG
jgi:catechol 2,3-dioxygenase-like lactoylglutathione lyase family enzyme